jgi:hypothetical protein
MNVFSDEDVIALRADVDRLEGQLFNIANELYEARKQRGELLAALKSVVANHCPNPLLFCSTCSNARAVIAKAEGAK